MKFKTRYFSLILWVWALNSCSSIEDSSNQTIQELRNGSGKKAILFIKYGEATVNNSLQVSIVEDADKIKKPTVGNVFISDSDSGAVGVDDAKIFWRHPDTLEVFYKKALRVFKSEQQLIGVTVVYRQVEYNYRTYK